MKRTLQTLAVSTLILGLSVGGSAQQEKELVDYVNPNIGGIGQLLKATSPIIKLPAGMASVAPITTPGITDRYLADKIYGFPAGGFTFMPLVGPPETDAAKNASLYDHDLETATPYYYRTTLEDSNTVVEYTVSAHAMYYRIVFPEGAKAHLLLGVPEGGEIDLASPTSLSGRGGAGAWRRRYFYAEFSKRVSSSNQVANLRIPEDRRQARGVGSGIMADFTPAKGEPIGIRVGISAISIDQARLNLRQEIPDWNFDGFVRKRGLPGIGR